MLFLAGNLGSEHNQHARSISSRLHVSSTANLHNSETSCVGDDTADDYPRLKDFFQSWGQRIGGAKSTGTPETSVHQTRREAGLVDSYSSDETIPSLKMRYRELDSPDATVSSRSSIRDAFASSHDGENSFHSCSSGSGSAIIRLAGADAAAIKGLTKYADRFFDKVKMDGTSTDGLDVFRIAEYVYAGYDNDVNGEGKMQFLDTRMLSTLEDGNDAFMLPFEVEDLVGTSALKDAQAGIHALLNIGSQITAAVLGMDSQSADKLIDTGGYAGDSVDHGGGSVSNSYHRLIRYPKPLEATDTAFVPHVDSSFLTLIPIPELPGLEVWCPAKSEGAGPEEIGHGEWVKPTIPLHDDDGAYVIAMAGEFLSLLSDGQVPTCIHRVIAPSAPTPVASESTAYKARISAPLFLRPRRGDMAQLDVKRDISVSNSKV